MESIGNGRDRRNGEKIKGYNTIYIYIYTSMRKELEWRILEIGSPKRLVKRDIWPVGPTSHLLSMSSTLGMSLFALNSLTSITLFSSIHYSKTKITHKKQKLLKYQNYRNRFFLVCLVLSTRGTNRIGFIASVRVLMDSQRH